MTEYVTGYFVHLYTYTYVCVPFCKAMTLDLLPKNQGGGYEGYCLDQYMVDRWEGLI